MIVLSLNLRWFEGAPAPKQRALKRLLSIQNPYILMVQETMTFGNNACMILEPWLKDWSFCLLEAARLLGGLITAWSPCFQALLSSMDNNITWKDLKRKDLNVVWRFVNIYRPYSYRKIY